MKNCLLIASLALLASCASDFTRIKNRMDEYKTQLREERAEHLRSENSENSNYIDLPSLPRS